MTDSNTTDSPSPASARENATLADLHWLCGGWVGELGPQRVEEAWSAPEGGTMSTMVRLLSGDATIMVELIVIRAHDETLTLHLRQFTPDLQLVTSQNMPLKEISDTHVVFAGEPGDNIPQLAYHLERPTSMNVHVTTADGTVVVATLNRR